jgi:hypothetical protein
LTNRPRFIQAKAGTFIAPEPERAKRLRRGRNAYRRAVVAKDDFERNIFGYWRF